MLRILFIKFSQDAFHLYKCLIHNFGGECKQFSKGGHLVVFGENGPDRFGCIWQLIYTLREKCDATLAVISALHVWTWWI